MARGALFVYYTIRYCTIVYYTILYYIYDIFYYTTLYYTILYHTIFVRPRPRGRLPSSRMNEVFVKTIRDKLYEGQLETARDNFQVIV